MAEDLNGPVVPAQLNYASALPVAIEAQSSRRLYFPSNGEQFGPKGVKQIRMNINSDSLVDFTHSYFKVTFENRGDAKLALDKGIPFIKRLQIQNNGQDLEDINDYGRLHAMLMDIQGSQNNNAEFSTTYHGPESETIDTTADFSILTQNAADILVPGTPANVVPVGGAAATVGPILNDAPTDPNKNIQMAQYGNLVDAEIHGGAAILKYGAVGAGAAQGTGSAIPLAVVNDVADGAAASVLIKNYTLAVANASSRKLADSLVPAVAQMQIETRGRIDKMINGANYNNGNGRNELDYPRNAAVFDNSATGGKFTFNFPLISCLTNFEKYFPLLLTKNGIDIIFHLAEATEVGSWAPLRGEGGGIATIPDYQLTQFRFVAHEVALDATFYDRLRASVSASNGVLSMAGTTYRHYLNIQNTEATAATYPLNITTRVKSLKALITRTMVSGQENSLQGFSVGCGFNPFIGNGDDPGRYQYRIGSVLHPATAVEVSKQNIGESIQELRKAWGTIGDYQHGTNMSKSSCVVAALIAGHDATTTPDTPGSGPGGRMANYAFGIDLEAFSKTATESGINVADRSLNVSMNLSLPAVATAYVARFDTFAMCDCIYYIGIDGSITTRI